MSRLPRHDPEFLEDVLDTLTGLVYVYDLVEERLVFISRRWREEFGLGDFLQEVPPTETLAKLIHPADFPALEAHYRALGESTEDQSRDIEYRLQRPDGSTAWVSAHDRPLRRDESGELRWIVGQARNVTARKAAETGRAEVEARFQAILENLPDAVFVASADARILLVNDAACSQLGYTRAELTRLRLADFVAPEFGPRARERLAGPSGSATTCESIHIRKDGTRVPVETVVVAVELEERPAYIGVARDISDRKRLESELRDAQRLESIGRLAAAVAHDFNNILAAIQGSASLLEGAHLSEGEHRELVAEVSTAACRGAELTRQLLTLGRRQPTDMRPTDLAETVDGALVVLRRLLDPSIEIRTELQRDCVVMADRGMLNQVVMNLALNARDAMPAGGRLTIRVGVSTTASDIVELVVCDTGAGMDESCLARAFEPFFTTKPAGKGSGVGLATVRGIVQQHGGTISVESEPGVGTRFCLSLRRSDAPPLPLSASAAGARAARKLTVLLVEETEAVRGVVSQMLESGGHRVLAAASPTEALRLRCRPEPLDLLMSNVTPKAESDALGLVRALRSRDPSLPVVLIGSLVADALLAQMPDCDFLQKPFTLGALNALLARRFPA